MQDSDEEKRCSEMADIAFDCEGKCRICPFPGFNCARHQMQSEKMTPSKKINSRSKN